MAFLVKEYDPVVLRDVEVPESFYERINTGSPVLDVIFGGEDLPGIMPGSSILLTGDPGAGKSTLVMQLVEYFAKELGISTLYNGGEESPARIKYRARRLGIDGHFAISGYSDVNRLVDYCRKTGVRVLVQDSAQSLTDEMGLHQVCQALTMLAEDGVTVFIIGHVTKANEFAGPKGIQHDVTVHAHLSYDPDTGNRVFELKKNRNGPALLPYQLLMTAQGLDLQQVAPDPDKQPGAGKSAKKEADAKFLEEVKRLLKEGEWLSGYSHISVPSLAEFGVNGGKMRLLLERAVSELQAEGLNVVQQTINQRRHWSVVGDNTNSKESP